MIVEQKFINKYKKQFYSFNVSVKSLMQQQKQLIKLLEELHDRTQKYFDTICQKVQMKNQSKNHSLRNSYVSKSNLLEVKLPSLVANAQLKNSKTYRKILEKEKSRLQRRVETCQYKLKQKDINQILEIERSKVLQMMKKNKSKQVQIKKLGDKLMQQNKSPLQIYEQLRFEVHKKRKQNSQKRKKLIQVHQRSQQLQRMTIQLDQTLQNRPQTCQPSPKQQKAAYKLKHLQNNCQALQQNIQSISKRLSQQYFLKLKQLQILVEKGQQLDVEIQSTKDKIQLRCSQLSNSGIHA